MITFILNNAPYGNEKSYNAIRLAIALIKKKQALYPWKPLKKNGRGYSVWLKRKKSPPKLI